MTSKGDLRKKLEFAFDIYDSDNNGDLSYNELSNGLQAMLKLLVHKRTFLAFHILICS